MVLKHYKKLKLMPGLHGLRLKIMLGVGLILLVGLGTFTYFDVTLHRDYFLEEEERKAAEISDTVMKSIEYPMLDGEMEQVQAILERLKTLKDIDVVHLVDLKGIIRYSGNRTGIGRKTLSGLTLEALRTGKLAQGLEVRRIEHPEHPEKILRYAMPIPNEKACFKCHGSEAGLLGVLTVGYKWSRIEQTVDDHLKRDILYAMLSVAFIAFFLYKWLTKSVTRPISALTAWADEVSRGNLDLKLNLAPWVRCWDLNKCLEESCPAFGREDIICSYVNGTLCTGQPMGKFPEKLEGCRECPVYWKQVGDEIYRLGGSFCHMVAELKRSRDELKQMYEKTLQSERLATIGRGVSYIAHEIKNPLMLIGGFSRQVQNSLKQDDPSRKKLQIVQEEIKRLEELLIELSDFTRFAGPKKSVQNINVIIEEVFDLVRPELERLGIEFNKSLDTRIPGTLFDPKQMKQVLINLAKNSIEAMSQGGKLSFSTVLEGDKIKIVLSDTGKGIPDENLKDVFNPFFTTKQRGTGLGLAISKKIIEDHGGEIDMKSKAGEGCTCTLTLPADQGEVPAIPADTT